MAHDVYISYATRDKSIADAVVQTLEVRGIRCWIAPRDIQPGVIWTEAIIDALNSCKVFILILSANYNSSKQVLREVFLADKTGAIIIPFRVEAVQPTEALQYLISQSHWIDAFTPPLEQHLLVLVKTVSRLLPEDYERFTPSFTEAAPVSASAAVEIEPRSFRPSVFNQLREG